MAEGSGGRGVDVGYYAIPILPSFEGIEAKINAGFGNKFGPAGTKAGQDYGKGVAGGIASSEAQVKAALDKHQALLAKQADAIGKVRVEQAKLNDLQKAGAGDTRVLAQTERLESAKRKESLAVKAATDAYAKYDLAQRQNQRTNQAMGGTANGGLFGNMTTGAERLVTALQKSASQMGPLGATASNVGGGFASMGGSMLAAGAAGGVMGAGVALAAGALTKVVEVGPEVVGKLYEIGASFNEMQNAVSFKTGATGGDLAKITESVDAVATRTPASISKIGGVAAEVTRSLHATGSDLETITQSITNLDVKTGEATNIRDLGKAFRGFGVDAADQNDALNQLYTASTRTGQSVNDLIHAVTVGGAPLRELGMDFGKSAALMSSFENAGLDGTKMVTGLRKAVGEFAKEHKDIPKALADSVTGLKNFKQAGDDASGIDLANKLFGPKTGVQFWDAIKSGALDLDNLSGSMQGTTLSINDMADQTETAGEKWQKLKNNIEVAVQPLASKLFDVTQSGLSGLSDWVSTHQASIIGFFTTVADVGIQMAQGLLKGFGDVVQGIGQFGHVLGEVVSGILQAGAALKDLMGDSAGADAWRKQADAAAQFGTGVEHVGDAMINAADGLNNWRDNLKAAGERAAEAAKLTDGLGTSVTTLKADGQNVTIDIKDNTPDVQTKLHELGMHLEQMANDPTHLKIVPDTPEAKATLDNFRAGENNTPITPPVQPVIAPAAKQTFDDFFKQYTTLIVTPQVGGGGNPTPQPNNLAGMMPHARGGIDVWSSVAAFANGGLPDRAIIQAPVGPGGLINWAEPSTHGEAYIPLAPSNRDRSQKIWAEVGKRLGVLKMESGGIAAYDAAIAEAQKIGDNRPYDYGGVGPRFDCSGAQSDIYAVLTGKPTGTRYFSTESDFASLGFKKGYMPGAYNIGVHNGGGGMNSHMAATLPNGVNFESGGAHNSTLYGKGAAGANDPQFENHYYLAVGGNPSGGAAGAGNAGGSAFGAGGYYTGGTGAGGGGGGTAAGAGTPGIGPNGEAGTYVADPKAVQSANDRVAAAEGKQHEAEAKLAELKADAKESEKIAAQNQVDTAKREVATAKQELATAQQGKFTPAKTGGEKTTTGGKSAKDPFGGAGNPGQIFASGILETLGLDGSWLPDIKNLGIVKLLGAIMKVGFNPVGTTGSTDASGTTTGGTDTGGGDPIAAMLGLPEGMIPNAVAPGPPAAPIGTPASGVGAGPPPGPVDQSTNIHINNPQGDPASIAKHARRALLNTPRLDTYAPAGAS